MTMARNSESTDYSSEMYGSLLIFRKGGEEGPKYDLSEGTTTIGSSNEADIRLKIQDDRLEPVHCQIEVNENGIAFIINKSIAAPVKINGMPLSLTKRRILKHEDHFEVLEKKFQYLNEDIIGEDYQKTITANRKSVAPVLQTKTVRTKIPVNHGQLKAAQRSRFPSFYTPEKHTKGSSGTVGCKSVSKLASKLPQPNRRLSLNLVPQILGASKRIAVPKKSCGCCTSSTEPNSPRKSILKKMASKHQAPDENKSANRKSLIEENDRSLPVDERKTDSYPTILVQDENGLMLPMEEEIMETAQTVGRNSVTRKVSLTPTNNLIILLHETSEQNKSADELDPFLPASEKTPETNVRSSRNAKRASTDPETSETLLTPETNPKNSSVKIRRTSRRFSRSMDGSVDNLPNSRNVDDPLIGEEEMNNATFSPEKDMQDMARFPETNKRQSNRFSERKQTASNSSEEERDLTPETSRRYSRNIGSSSAKINASTIGKARFSLEEEMPKTIQRRSVKPRTSSVDNLYDATRFSEKKQTSVGNSSEEEYDLAPETSGRASSALPKAKTPETNQRYSRNIASSSATKRTSAKNHLRDDSLEKQMSETEMESSRKVQRTSSVGDLHRNSDMMVFETKTPETSSRASRNFNRSSQKKRSFSARNSSEEEHDLTPETSPRRFSSTPSIDDFPASALEEEIPETKSRSSRSVQKSSAKHRASSETSQRYTRTSAISHFQEEDDSTSSVEEQVPETELGSPRRVQKLSGQHETSKRVSRHSDWPLERKRLSSNSNSSEEDDVKPETSRRYSRSTSTSGHLQDSASYSDEEMLETGLRSSRNLQRSSIDQRTSSVGDLTPETNKRVTRNIVTSSEKKRASSASNLPEDNSTPDINLRYSRNIASSSARKRTSSVPDSTEEMPKPESRSSSKLQRISSVDRTASQNRNRVSKHLDWSSEKKQTSFAGNSSEEETNLTPETCRRYSAIGHQELNDSTLSLDEEIPATKSRTSSRNVQSSSRTSTIGHVEEDTTAKPRNSDESSKRVSRHLEWSSGKKRASLAGNSSEEENLTPETSRRYSRNLASSPETANSPQEIDDSTSSLEEETSQTKLRSSRNVQRTSSLGDISANLPEEHNSTPSLRHPSDLESSSARKSTTAIDQTKLRSSTASNKRLSRQRTSSTGSSSEEESNSTTVTDRRYSRNTKISSEKNGSFSEDETSETERNVQSSSAKQRTSTTPETDKRVTRNLVISSEKNIERSRSSSVKDSTVPLEEEIPETNTRSSSKIQRYSVKQKISTVDNCDAIGSPESSKRVSKRLDWSSEKKRETSLRTSAIGYVQEEMPETKMRSSRKVQRSSSVGDLHKQSTVTPKTNKRVTISVVVSLEKKRTSFGSKLPKATPERNIESSLARKISRPQEEHESPVFLEEMPRSSSKVQRPSVKERVSSQRTNSASSEDNSTPETRTTLNSTASSSFYLQISNDSMSSLEELPEVEPIHRSSLIPRETSKRRSSKEPRTSSASFLPEQDNFTPETRRTTSTFANNSTFILEEQPETHSRSSRTLQRSSAVQIYPPAENSDPESSKRVSRHSEKKGTPAAEQRYSSKRVSTSSNLQGANDSTLPLQEETPELKFSMKQRVASREETDVEANRRLTRNMDSSSEMTRRKDSSIGNDPTVFLEETDLRERSSTRRSNWSSEKKKTPAGNSSEEQRYSRKRVSSVTSLQGANNATLPLEEEMPETAVKQRVSVDNSREETDAKTPETNKRFARNMDRSSEESNSRRKDSSIGNDSITFLEETDLRERSSTRRSNWSSEKKKTPAGNSSEEQRYSRKRVSSVTSLQGANNSALPLEEEMPETAVKQRVSVDNSREETDAKTPETNKRFARNMDRSSEESNSRRKDSSIGNDSITFLEETDLRERSSTRRSNWSSEKKKTPAGNSSEEQRYSRKRVSSVTSLQGANNATLPLEEEMPETAVKQRVSVDNSREETDAKTPETNKRFARNMDRSSEESNSRRKDSSIGNDSITFLEETDLRERSSTRRSNWSSEKKKTPAGNSLEDQRYSRSINGSSRRKRVSSMSSLQGANDSTLPLEEEMPETKSRSSSKQRVASVDNSRAETAEKRFSRRKDSSIGNDSIVFLEETGPRERSSAKRRTPSISDEENGTPGSRKFSRSSDRSSPRKTKSLAGNEDKVSSVDVREANTPETNLRSSRNSLRNDTLISISDDDLGEESDLSVRSVIGVGLSNRSTRSRSRTSSVGSLIVEEIDLVTPMKASEKKNRASAAPYRPQTEDVTPTTPDNKKGGGGGGDSGFKTPLNTPGLFQEIKKSMLKSRSRLQKSASNLMEAFEKDDGGLKRRRESAGEAGRSTKKMRLVINEDDTFEQSHVDSSELFDSSQSEDALELEESAEHSVHSKEDELKKQLASPKARKSPKNDLSNIVAIKRMFATPKIAKSPKNDLTDVPNLRKIMSPKTQNSPANDLTDVRGLKRLLKTPKAIVPASPDRFSDVSGVAQMFDVSGVHRLSVDGSDAENNEELFDRLFDKRPPPRTYRGQSASPAARPTDAYGADRRRTLSDLEAASSPRVRDWVEEQQTVFDAERASNVVDEDEKVRIETDDEDKLETSALEEETSLVDSPLPTRSRRNLRKVVQTTPPKVTKGRKKVEDEKVTTETDDEDKLETSALAASTEDETGVVDSPLPTRGRRNLRKVQTTPPKVTKGRKKVEDEKVTTETDDEDKLETSALAASTEDETGVVDSPLPTRGRRNLRKVQTTPPKATKGRKKVKQQDSNEDEKVRKETDEEDKLETSALVESTEEETSALLARGRRNLRKVVQGPKVKKVEKQDSNEDEKVTTETDDEDKLETSAVAASTEEETSTVDSPLPTRGRRNLGKVVQGPKATRGRNKVEEQHSSDISKEIAQEVPAKKSTRTRDKAEAIKVDASDEKETAKAATRRGRNANTAKPEEKAEEVDQPKPNKPVNRRGRNAKPVSDEEEKEKPVDQIEATKRPATRTRNAKKLLDEEQENREETVAKKPTNRRGRHAKPVLTEDADEPVAPTGRNEEPVGKPANRAKRNVETEKLDVDLVDEKPTNRRGRHAKTVLTEDAENQKNVTEEPPVKKPVTRRGKIVLEDNEEPIEKKPATRRGRAAKTHKEEDTDKEQANTRGKNAKKLFEDVEDSAEEAEPKTRGRQAKTEETVDEEPVAKKAPQRRGRNAKTPLDVDVEQKEVVKVPAKRGGKAAAKAVRDEETDKEEDAGVGSVPKRGRRGQKATDDKKTNKTAESNKGASDEITTPVKKTTRARGKKTEDVQIVVEETLTPRQARALRRKAQ